MKANICSDNKILYKNENASIFNPLRNILLIKKFLDKESCNFIIKKAEEYGKWTSNRHKNYPTTDIPVNDIPGIEDIISDISSNVISEIKKSYYLESECVINPYDLFVVKYDTCGQSGLDIHRDQSEFSFVLLLSDPSDFEGGGTIYKERNLLVNPDEKGSISIHFGKLYHGGKNITKGTRYILIGFLKTKSNKLMIPNYDENQQFTKDRVCDKRLFDYYWIGNKIDPINIYIKIINLKYRKEKLKRILENINKLKVPTNINLNVEVFEADEGKIGTPYHNWDKVKYEAPDKIKKFYMRNITKGEFGCYNSHMKIINNFSQNDEYLLILEDDAEFDSDFIYRINQSITELKNKNMYWDTINFGSRFMMENKSHIITESLIEREFFYEAHCILYSNSGITKIKNVKNNEIIPWDDYLNSITESHFSTKINNIFKLDSKFIMYHYHPRLSKQISVINGVAIHDTEPNSIFISIPNSKQIIVNEKLSLGDLKNWYRIFDVGEKNLEKIMNLCIQANNSMWNFDISNIDGSFESTNINNWTIAINNKRKIVIAALLSDKSKLELFNTKISNLKKNNILFFPSYLSFKCEDVAIFYANGSTFK